MFKLKNMYKIEKKVDTYWLAQAQKKYATYMVVDENEKVLCELSVEKESLKFKNEFIPSLKGKKVLHLFRFETKDGFRNKGYGKILLKEVLKRYKGKYDAIHLNACPYKHNKKNKYLIRYTAPSGGLKKTKLISFYESFGFKKYGIVNFNEYDGKKNNYVVMILTKQ